MSKIYKLLIVDDDPSIVRVLQRILKQEPYEISTTSDPAQAIAMVEKEDFDLILSDFHMGTLSGVDIFKKCEELKRKAKRVMMTGTPNSTLSPDLHKELSVFNLILKPWDNESLKKILRAALDIT